jgi:hypothetical protein
MSMKTLAVILVLLFCSTGYAELMDRAGLLEAGSLITAGFDHPGQGHSGQEAPETIVEGEFCSRTFVCCHHQFSVQLAGVPEFHLPPDPRIDTIFAEIQTPPPRMSFI